MFVVVIVMIVIMSVVVFMSVKREGAARSRAKQRPIFWRRSHDRGGALATNMMIEADNAVRGAHNHMQFVADHQNGTAGIIAHCFDLLVKRRRTALIQALSGLV